MATRPNNTVIPFPSRGGTGFSVPAETKLKTLDLVNLYPFPSAKSVGDKKARSATTSGLERTPEILIAMAIFKQLPHGRKNMARYEVQRVVEHFPDCEAARAALTVLEGIK